MGKISDMLEHYFSIPLPLNSVNARLLGMDNYFSNNKAIEEFDMEKTEINNSINQAINWFNQNKI